MTDFITKVNQGRKLVLLDDMILDVGVYAAYHPGGAFLLEHNIGRDISKFFYGGYSLDTGRDSKIHAHSTIPRSIVNSLVVARLVKKAPIMKTKIKHEHKVNSTASTFTFESIGKSEL